MAHVNQSKYAKIQERLRSTADKFGARAFLPDKKSPHEKVVRAFYCLIMTSYFLWHFAQLSLMANALVPLWQPPQNLPASMSFMVIISPPFFILKRPD